MTCTLNDLGIIKRFNGVDIQHGKEFIELSCNTYIDKIVNHHQWQTLPAAKNLVPMRTDSKFIAEL